MRCQQARLRLDLHLHLDSDWFPGLLRLARRLPLAARRDRRRLVRRARAAKVVHHVHPRPNGALPLGLFAKGL